MSVPDQLRKRYPFTARVLTPNAYGLPIGKEFICARRKEGDGSPFSATSKAAHLASARRVVKQWNERYE